jgi:hypothetical protein
MGKPRATPDVKQHWMELRVRCPPLSDLGVGTKRQTRTTRAFSSLVGSVVSRELGREWRPSAGSRGRGSIRICRLARDRGANPCKPRRRLRPGTERDSLGGTPEGSPPVRPKQPAAEPQEDLFRARLENLVDLRHPLVRLAGLVGWGRFEAEFGALCTDGGRPGLPTRLMVGLHLLKHMTGSRTRRSARATWTARMRSSSAARCSSSTPGGMGCGCGNPTCEWRRGPARGRQAHPLRPPASGRAAAPATPHLARAPGPRHRPQDRR